MKRDWKKELNDKMYEEWHIDGEDEVDVETFIESLLSEQEEEWKKQMREAIINSVELALSMKQRGNGIMMLGIIPALFKKYNCEECHHHVTNKSDGKCVKCGEQVLIKGEEKK